MQWSGITAEDRGWMLGPHCPQTLLPVNTPRAMAQAMLTHSTIARKAVQADVPMPVLTSPRRNLSLCSSQSQPFLAKGLNALFASQMTSQALPGRGFDTCRT